MIKVTHFLGSLNPDSGGPPPAVLGLCSGLVARGVDPWLLVHSPGNIPQDKSFSILELSTKGTYFFKQKTISQVLRQIQPAIVHDHALWEPSNHRVASQCRRLNIPRVITIHGMLEPWALKQKRLKKQLALKLYQMHDLETARCLHATSESEAEQLRNLGLRLPIMIIPNGIDIPTTLNYESKSRDFHSSKRALFLSRVHPKKGLRNLVKAWAIVRPSNWIMEIVGMDSEGHRKEIEDEVERNGLSSSFVFKGPLHDKDKWEAYCRADLFVLPTFSENFGMVIAESLGVGVPVITTRGAPWKELLSHNCGWWIDIGVAPLVEALTAATRLSDTERTEMGMRGQKLIQARYSLSKVADDMKSAYEWILGQSSQPDHVQLD
jgi:glycosyltransferase involved in cell wall biosynthesis